MLVCYIARNEVSLSSDLIVDVNLNGEHITLVGKSIDCCATQTALMHNSQSPDNIAGHPVSHITMEQSFKSVSLPCLACSRDETRCSPGTAGPAVGWPGKVQRFLVWRPLASLVMRLAVIAWRALVLAKLDA